MFRTEDCRGTEEKAEEEAMELRGQVRSQMEFGNEGNRPFARAEGLANPLEKSKKVPVPFFLSLVLNEL